MTADWNDLPADLQREVAGLRAERDAALAREAARAEVLSIINASRGDLAPVFDAILERAMRLCEAEFGSLYTYVHDDDRFHSQAQSTRSEAYAEFRTGQSFVAQPGAPIRRMLEAKQTVHIEDLKTDASYRLALPGVLALVDFGGARTLLTVPLVSGDSVIGAITIYRREVHVFSKNQVALAESFAAQAVIAMENARLLVEQREALEQQTATADVLRVINASQGDLKPVFDDVLDKAARLCGAAFGELFTYDGDRLHLATTLGVPPAWAEMRVKMSPMRPLPDGPLGRLLSSKQTVLTLDLMEEAGYKAGVAGLRAMVAVGEARTVLTVPLLRDGAVKGVVAIYRKEVRAFSARQIALLENFAAQAVIAMENARLLNETREALEQQTATAEVLGVINANPGELVPVFDAMLEKAARLSDAPAGAFWLIEGDMIRAAATLGFTGSYDEMLRTPRESGPTSLIGRLARGSGVAHIPDFAQSPGYLDSDPITRATVDQAGLRTGLGIPLQKNGVPLGAFVMARFEVRPFTEKQIDLLRAFAAQAVIAMENARLLTETREALERQTAMADVLRVINANPGDLAPVYETILNMAHKLCGAIVGNLTTFDGEYFHTVATHGFPDDHVDMMRRPFRPTTFRQRLIDGERLIHIRDLKDIAARGAIGRTARLNTDIGRNAILNTDVRTTLMVPLRKDGVLIGTISSFRLEVRPFLDDEIALVENFAAQAVIAMENARLMSETREALEQQTATAEVLGVINASPGDLAPVFDVLLDKALRLCGATFGELAVPEGPGFRSVATKGMPAAFAEFRAARTSAGAPGSVSARFMAGETCVHISDLASEDAYLSGDPSRRALVDLGGARALAAIALRKDGTLFGAILIYRGEAGPFSDRQITLLENFAAQAVIAMENARLLTETREALEQQTATAEVLGVINASPGELTPVFDAILEKSLRLAEAAFGTVWIYEGDHQRAVISRGMTEALAAFRADNPTQVLATLPTAVRINETKRSVHHVDVREGEGYLTGVPGSRAVADLGGARSLVTVPLVKDQTVIGTIQIYRQEVRAFSEKQIALLENFAAQAVIAMENARLLTETREALEQQTATAEVLGIINANPGDLTPVFNAILEKSHTLCDAAVGSLYIWDGEHIQAVATHGLPEEYAAFARRKNPTNFMVNALLAGERYYATPDLKALGHVQDRHVLNTIEQTNVRSLLMIPLRKDGALIGFISSVRVEVRPFGEKEVALLENFAAQAVIAMENARLLTETREALEQQTATAEVLRVINASPGDLKPVFDAILEKGMRLCHAAFGHMSTWDGERVHPVASRGFPPAFTAYVAARGSTTSFAPVVKRMMETKRPTQVADVRDGEGYRNGHPDSVAVADLGGARTLLHLPLLKDETFVGYLTVYRQEKRPYSEKEIALLESFTAQAVIAMESARLLNELRARTEELAQRQAELRVTFENMGDGVAMFDGSQRLVSWNRRFQDILEIPDEVLSPGTPFPDYIRYLAERGEYGTDTSVDEQVRRVLEAAGQLRRFERTRPDGRVIEVRNNPVDGGGFVLIFSDVTERKRHEAALAAARDAAEEAARTIETAFRELKIAQANLVQSEKMASLGQLTAGIAHEIKNPLNFVNNFAILSVDLLQELIEAVTPAIAALTDDQRADVDDISGMLTTNLQKITEHGRRADGIVKAMLEHSRGASGERRAVDINALAEEALNLAYHGARARDQSFNITLERDLAEGIAPIALNPQDMSRVFLNLFVNGFYAANQRAKSASEAGFSPILKVATRDLGDAVEVRIRDNGTGIPETIRDKLFEPFFTTKPTGEGTGLGLSITYDIVTKQHGGTIAVDSEVDAFTEFVVTLPRQMFTGDSAAT